MHRLRILFLRFYPPPDSFLSILLFRLGPLGRSTLAFRGASWLSQTGSVAPHCCPHRFVRAKAACWRRFYRTISRLVASSDTGPVPDTLRAELVRAIGRLRQFLSENRDLADPPAIGELEYTVLGRTAAGA